MPVYEYNCHGCKRVVSVFQRRMFAQTTPVCPNCESTELERRISRVRVLKGKREYGDVDRERLMSHFEGNDRGSQASWARRMASELGEAGGDFREMAEKVEAGEQVFDLYDPAPMLDHKISERIEGDGDSGGEDGGGDSF